MCFEKPGVSPIEFVISERFYRSDVRYPDSVKRSKHSSSECVLKCLNLSLTQNQGIKLTAIENLIANLDKLNANLKMKL